MATRIIRFGILSSFCKNQLIFRSIHLTSNARYPSNNPVSNPEADKTKVTILNKEEDIGLMIDTCSTFGFRLNNGLFCWGPIAIFPKSVLSWNVSGFDEINEDSLSLFCQLEPRLEILVIGVGSTLLKSPLPIMNFLKGKKIATEILPTEQACTTFNFLNSERRCVAGAIIPPEKLSVSQTDLFAIGVKKHLENPHIDVLGLKEVPDNTKHRF